MLGSRFLGDPLAGGMPKWKYISNRFLTIVENLAFGLHLSEYHTGLRAYSRRLLETIPYRLNSDDFVFDQELIAQVVAAGMGRRIGEIGVPTRYFEEASSVGFKRSVVYGLSTLRVVLRYLLHRLAHPPLAEAQGPHAQPPRPRLTGDRPVTPRRSALRGALVGVGHLGRRALFVLRGSTSPDRRHPAHGATCAGSPSCVVRRRGPRRSAASAGSACSPRSSRPYRRCSAIC